MNRLPARWAMLPAVAAAMALVAACTSSTSGTPVSQGLPPVSGGVSSSPPAGASSSAAAPGGATTSSSASAPASKTSASTAKGGGAGGGKGSGKCPTAAQVSALAGTTFPAPQTNSSAGSSVCSYNNTSTGANVVIVISPATPGLSPALLKTVVADAAKAQKVDNVHEVSGLGDGAFEFTAPDATSQINHVPSTFLEVLTSTSTIALTGPIKASALEAIARLVISG